MHKNLLMVLLVAASLCGCVSAAELDPMQSADVVINDTSMRVSRGEQVLLSVEFDAGLETTAGADDLLLWRLDNSDQVNAARLSEGRIETFSFTAPLDAEAICFRRRARNDYDLFVGDGDGLLVHFWMTLKQGVMLQEVRQIWTNPDVERCQVTDDRVYVENGPLGVTAFARDEETDLVMYAVDEFTLEANATSLSLNENQTPQLREETVVAAFETTPVASAGDAADDPVVLVSADTAAWIVGTDKQLGLNAYDLDGQLVTQINQGRLNNVDALLRDDGTFLLAASNRSAHTLDLFQANPDAGMLRLLSETAVELDDPYGLCMGEVEGKISVFIGGKDGVVQQWQIAADTARLELVRSFQFESQTEGCVVDASAKRLFVGEEAVGIWSVDLLQSQQRLVAEVRKGGLVADVEGLDICIANGNRVLIASSQGDDSFLVFPFLGDALGDPVKFKVVADLTRGIDGVSETDGLACDNQTIDGFPRGVLVVQDGRNRAPEQNQNFKVVDWRQIEALLQ